MGALLNIPGRRVSRFGFEWMGNVCYALQFRMLRDGCFTGCICYDKDWKIGGRRWDLTDCEMRWCFGVCQQPETCNSEVASRAL